LEIGRLPHVRLSVHGPKKMANPDFLHAALDTNACAAFSKESRMKCANAIKLHRKSGGSPNCSYPERVTENVTNTISLHQSQHLLHLCPQFGHFFP
jgi:hypothetical protein